MLLDATIWSSRYVPYPTYIVKLVAFDHEL